MENVRLTALFFTNTNITSKSIIPCETSYYEN